MIIQGGCLGGRGPLALHAQGGSAEEPVRSLRTGFSFQARDVTLIDALEAQP